VLVAVQDAGVGIDSRRMDELFTAKPGGMSMGLSISRSIIEAHGGDTLLSPLSLHHLDRESRPVRWKGAGLIALYDQTGEEADA
jgi:Signal transduction histidine kinase